MAKSTPEEIEYEPPTCIRMSKDQAQEVSIGDKVKITVQGEVTSISRDDFGPLDKANGKYRVELKKASVSQISTDMADKELRSLQGK